MSKESCELSDLKGTEFQEIYEKIKPFYNELLLDFKKQIELLEKQRKQLSLDQEKLFGSSNENELRGIKSTFANFLKSKVHVEKAISYVDDLLDSRRKKLKNFQKTFKDTERKIEGYLTNPSLSFCDKKERIFALLKEKSNVILCSKQPFQIKIAIDTFNNEIKKLSELFIWHIKEYEDQGIKLEAAINSMGEISTFFNENIFTKINQLFEETKAAYKLKVLERFFTDWLLWFFDNPFFSWLPFIPSLRKLREEQNNIANYLQCLMTFHKNQDRFKNDDVIYNEGIVQVTLLLSYLEQESKKETANKAITELMIHIPAFIERLRIIKTGHDTLKMNVCDLSNMRLVLEKIRKEQNALKRVQETFRTALAIKAYQDQLAIYHHYSTPLLVVLRSKDITIEEKKAYLADLIKGNIEKNQSPCDINEFGKCGKTPLHLAVKQNSLELVKFLCENGAINYGGFLGKSSFKSSVISRSPKRSALFLAFLLKRKEIIHYLIENGGGIGLSLSELFFIRVRQSNVADVKFLLEEGSAYLCTGEKTGINARELVNLNAPLHEAVKNGSKECVSLLLSAKGINKDVLNAQGKTPLAFAVEIKNIELVKLFLNHGENLSKFTEEQKNTLLYLAIQGEDDDVFVKRLLNEGACIELEFSKEEKDANGNNPLHVAARKGNAKIIEVVLNWLSQLSGGLGVFQQKNNEGDTLIHIAIRESEDYSYRFIVGHIISKLARCRLNIDIPNRIGDTPLHVAIKAGRLCVIKWLLSKDGPGVVFNRQNEAGDLALHLAVRVGYWTVVKWLFECARREWEFLSINVANQHGDTPLHEAARKNAVEDQDYVQVIDLLLENISIDAVNQQGYTALHLAVGQGGFLLAEKLIQKGACVDIPNSQGNTVLHAMANRGDVDLVQKWINQQKTYWFNNAASILNLSGEGDNTALHVAAKANHIGLVKVLIENGVTINTRNQQGNTALHLAIESENLEIVDYLIKQGANVHIKNEAGKNPFEIDSGRKLLYLIIHLKGGFSQERYYKQSYEKLVEEEIVQQYEKTVVLPSPVFSNHLFTHYQQSDYPEKTADKDKARLATEFIILDQPLMLATHTNEIGSTILHLASKKNDIELAQWIKTHVEKQEKHHWSILLHTTNREGEASLHIAVREKNLEMVCFLLEEGIDVDISNQNGDMAWNIALQAKDPQLMALVYSEKSHQILKNKIPTLDLMQEDACVFWVNVLRTIPFKQRASLLNLRDKNGNTLLHAAVQQKALKDVVFLMDNGVNIRIKNAEHQSAFELATICWHKERDSWVNLLISMKEDIKGFLKANHQQKIYVEETIYEYLFLYDKKQYTQRIALFENMGITLSELQKQYVLVKSKNNTSLKYEEKTLMEEIDELLINGKNLIGSYKTGKSRPEMSMLDAFIQGREDAIFALKKEIGNLSSVVESDVTEVVLTSDFRKLRAKHKEARIKGDVHADELALLKSEPKTVVEKPALTARAQYEELIQEVIQTGNDALTTSDGKTLLHLAVEIGNLDLVTKILHEKPILIEMKTRGMLLNSLDFAIQKGSECADFEIAKLLVSKGANVQNSTYFLKLSSDQQDIVSGYAELNAALLKSVSESHCNDAIDFLNDFNKKIQSASNDSKNYWECQRTRLMLTKNEHGQTLLQQLCTREKERQQQLLTRELSDVQKQQRQQDDEILRVLMPYFSKSYVEENHTALGWYGLSDQMWIGAASRQTQSQSGISAWVKIEQKGKQLMRKASAKENNLIEVYQQHKDIFYPTETQEKPSRGIGAIKEMNRWVLENKAAVDPMNAVDDEGNTLLHLAVKDNMNALVKWLLPKKLKEQCNDFLSQVGNLLRTAGEAAVTKITTIVSDKIAEEIDSRVAALGVGTTVTVVTSVALGPLSIPLGVLAGKAASCAVTFPIGKTAEKLADLIINLFDNEKDLAALALPPQYIDINQQNKTGDTPLHIAVQDREIFWIALLLLGAGADIKKENNFGETPLHLAVQAGNVEMVEILANNLTLRKINAKNKRGETPLHIAVQNGDVQLVNFLLEKGANPEIKTIFGQTAADLMQMKLDLLINAKDKNVEGQYKAYAAMKIPRTSAIEEKSSTYHRSPLTQAHDQKSGQDSNRGSPQVNSRVYHCN